MVAEEIGKFGKDLVEEAKAGRLSKVIGRDDEIRRVIRILSRKTKSNPVLVGEPGVGKTAIAEGVAQRVASGLAPSWMRRACILSVDTGKLVEKAAYPGEFEAVIRSLADFIARSDRLVIPFIDELHAFLAAGQGGGMSAGELLKPMLARGELRCIGATTFDEYRRYIARDPALERRFAPVKVDEPNSEQAYAILAGLKPEFEEYHNVVVEDQALKAAITLSQRFIVDRKLPDKAVDLLDEACAAVRITIRDTGDAYSEEDDIEATRSAARRQLEEAERDFDLETVAKLYLEHPDLSSSRRASELGVAKAARAKACVSERTIAEVVSELSGVPVEIVMPVGTGEPDALEREMRKRFVGQESVLSEVARTVAAGRRGFAPTSRPSASFHFFGEGGTGKTTLCRVLAKAAFGSADKLSTWDLSEYTGQGALFRLIGTPPGYADHEKAGALTECIRRQPFSVVVFEGWETADSDTKGLVRQICETGRIKDSHGRIADVGNCVVIIVSRRRDGILAGLVDTVLEFEALNEQERLRIAELLLSDLAEKVGGSGVLMRYDPSVVRSLAAKGDAGNGPWAIDRACRVEIEPLLGSAIGTARERGKDVHLYCEAECLAWRLV